jgi:YggT family protein
MNLNPFIELITAILSIYSFLLFVYIIIYYLLVFKVINQYSPVIVYINNVLVKLIEPVLKKIRRYIPPIGGVDISVIVLFLLINFVKSSLITYFYTY